MGYMDLSAAAWQQEYDKVSAEYEGWKAKGLKLNMARGKPGMAWVTVQTHLNVVAVASLHEMACIILPEDIRMDEVLNVLVRPPAEAPAEVETLAAQRADARKRRDWAESDRLRDAIAALGWTVKDAPEGQKLAPK